MKRKIISLSFMFVIILTIFFTPYGVTEAKPKKKDGIINNSHVEGNVWRFQENVSVQILNESEIVYGYYRVNVYVIEQEDGLILIDSGVESFAKQLRRMLDDKFNKKEIKAILLTHAHADHAGGAKFLSTGRTAIYAHLSDWPLIQSGMSFLNDTQFTYKGYSPTNVLDNEVLLYNACFVRYTPGHTNGSVTFEYCLPDLEETTILFTGDTTLPYPDPEFPQYEEFPDDLTFVLDFYTCVLETHDFDAQIDSILQLSSINADIICPGHAELDYEPSAYLFNSFVLVNVAKSINESMG